MAVDILVIATLVASLIVILLSCEIFVNGIEWLGSRLGLADSATGSVLAAVGTAMPETLIPIIAIFMSGGEGTKDIAVGAILGAPFMLTTLAMFLGGLTVFLGTRRGRRGPVLVLDRGHAERDLGFFFLMYLLALATALFEHANLRFVIAGVLFVAYGVYLRRVLSERRITEAELADLYLSRLFARPQAGLPLIITQVVAALLGIILGAWIFVGAVEEISLQLGISELVLAFVLAPIASELPEKFNSITWYWRSKDSLALGNISGAMVFQSSVPVSIGVLFTAWTFENAIEMANILFALAGAGILFLSLHFRKRIDWAVMLTGGLLYVGYLVLLFSSGASVGA